MGNTIVAQDGATSGADLFGAFQDNVAYQGIGLLGHNLIGSYDPTVASGLSAANGDQLATPSSPINPKLSAPANNGGPTRTQALQSGSPANNKGKDLSSFGITTDQRGDKRSSPPDIGAWDDDK